MGKPRRLIVMADDFGMGPATTAGILDLARQGLISASVLLVNSPYAKQAVAAWRRAGEPMELGWHPCLTLDRPILSSRTVRTLVRDDGTFWPLGQFIRRLMTGRMNPVEIEAELQAQHQRFVAWMGHVPRVVNSHQHVQLFPPVGAKLLKVLGNGRPYVRRVREPWRGLLKVPGARCKRAFLNVWGRREARRLENLGYPGNDWFAGIAEPGCVRDPLYFERWLRSTPGDVVELMCHPGRRDPTLIGRDCSASDGLVQRRVDELHLMEAPGFRAAIRAAGFVLTNPVEISPQKPPFARPTQTTDSRPSSRVFPAGAAARFTLDFPEAACYSRSKSDRSRSGS